MYASKALRLSYLAFVLSIIIFIKATESQSACNAKTCGKCISTKYTCAWCSEKNFTLPRCGAKSDLKRNGCPSSFIENPATSTVLIDNEAVRDGKAGGINAIQIQPQYIKVKTRPRLNMVIPINFRAANNYPVDLYFLYDVSGSMKAAVANLANLASDISQSIGDISSNYRMGYGVFQDKTVLPFTDTSPERLKNPCITLKPPDNFCDPAFEFKHLLSMSRNVAEFKKVIENTKFTGNLDHPEGSLDAIMQAVTCKSKVGWRTGRKMLIFSSNAPFHSAGAGRLAGIVSPNDGKCHLNGDGQYSMELSQDYPSVSQLTQAVGDTEMHVIFIVSNDLQLLFHNLSSRIPQSIVERLDNPNDPDNLNIKKVIEEKYKEIISEVEILHNNLTGVEVTIKAESKECEETGTNKCKGLKMGTKIDFNVEIRVTECPEKKEDRIKKLILHPKSLKNEQLVIDLEIICECGCGADKSKWDTSNKVCTNGNGTLKCGVCDCNDGRSGLKCECDNSESDALDSGCLADNTSLPCTGHGSCSCGQCTCDDGYSDTFCQCNDKNCKSFKGEVCGGMHGYCNCGKCVCEKGYTGAACECPTSDDTCLEDGVLCGDKGSCACGVCKCDPGYSGNLCQDCFLCGDRACDIKNYRDCAKCFQFDPKGISCASLDCPKVEVVMKLPDTGSNACSVLQSDDCFLQYTASVNEGNVTLLYVQETKTCPQPLDIVPIVAGVVAGVVAIGVLLLIIWKVSMTLYDRVEYSKFQEDLKKCKWAKHDNPFYKEATMTYKNPLADSAEQLN